MTKIAFKKDGRRLIVSCPAGHPILAALAARPYHHDGGTATWWRAHSESEVEWLTGKIAEFELRGQPPKIDPALIVTGDTFPVKEALSKGGCRYDGEHWVASTRQAAEEARLFVALESMRRLGLPMPPPNLQYPPPTFILAGRQPDDIAEKLKAMGATWVSDWGCWSIQNRAAVKEAQMLVKPSPRPGVAPNPAVAPARPEPWKETPLPEGAFAVEYFAPFVKRAPLFNGETMKIAGKLAVVVNSGVEFGRNGEPNRVWMHLRHENTPAT